MSFKLFKLKCWQEKVCKTKNILPSSNSEVENFTEKEGQKISKNIVNIFYIINVNVCIYLIGKTHGQVFQFIAVQIVSSAAWVRLKLDINLEPRAGSAKYNWSTLKSKNKNEQSVNLFFFKLNWLWISNGINYFKGHNGLPVIFIVQMFFIVDEKRVTFLLCTLNNPSCARTIQFKIHKKLQKK